MQLPLIITFPDAPDREPINVVAGPRDQLVWERAEKGRSLGDLLVLNVKIEDLYALAHTAATRKGLYVGDLKAFEAEADVEMGRRDASDEDPTQPDPSTGS